MEEVKEENKQVEQEVDPRVTEAVHRLMFDNFRRTLMASKYRSVERALKRGHISGFLELRKKRPFNNRANTSTRKGKHSRYMAELTRQMYESRRKVEAKREANEQPV